MKKKLILSLLSLLLGGIFLWLSFRNVSVSEVVSEIKSVDWKYLIPAFLIGLLSHVFRALRWGVILKRIKEINFSRLFSINSVGFLAIHIFPFRIGEVVKPYLLKKKEEVSFSAGFATVGIERVFDGLTLVLFLIFSLIFANFKTETIPYVGKSINYLIIAGALIFGISFLFLFLLVYNQKIAIKIITKLMFLFPEKLKDRVVSILSKFVHGLSSLLSIRKSFWISFHSLVIWLCAVAIMYLVFLSFRIKLPWEASFVALGIVSLGIMLPAPPGFIGNFQLFCQGALGLYGIGAATGLSYSIVVHAINIGGVFLLGFIYLPSNFVSYKAIVESEKMADQESNTTSLPNHPVAR